MINDGPLKFEIEDDELREKLEQEIIRQVIEAQESSQVRNDLFGEYDLMLEGLGATNTNTRWDDACELDDPMTRNAHMTMQAQVVSVLRKETKIMVTSYTAELEKSAEDQEDYLTVKWNENNVTSHLNDVAYNCLRYPVGLIYSGWRQVVRPERGVQYRKKGSHLLVDEENKEDGVEYEEVPVESDIEQDGLEYRVVDTLDFYLYPIDSKSVETAEGVGERQWMSSRDLLMGIEDFGYDHDAVMKILRSGEKVSRTGDDNANPVNARAVDDYGESEQTGWECFCWYTKLPILMEEGDILTPTRYLYDDFLCICHPASQTMLRMDFAPDKSAGRPYTPFYAWKKPGEFYGLCVPMILDSTQAEANANLRLTIDSMNMEMTPMFKVKESILAQYARFKVSPGAFLPFKSSPDEIQILEMPQHSKDGLALQQYLHGQGDALVGGNTQYQPKVRKAGEVAAVQQATGSKFDLILFQFGMGIETLAARTLALCALHMNDDGEEFTTEEDDKPHKITPHALKGKYLYKATANAQDANPEFRIQRSIEMQKIATEYLMLVVQGIPPQVLALFWNSARQTLVDMGAHNIEKLIGKAPDENAPPMMPPPQGAMNGAANGGAGQPQQQAQPVGTPAG